MTRRFKVFFILAFGLATLIFFHRPILSWGLSSVIAWTFHTADHVSYEKIGWESGKLQVTNLSVEDPSYQLRIDSVCISFALGRIGVDITHPEIHMSADAGSKTKLLPLGVLSYLQPQIEQGVFQVKNSPRLYFSVEEGENKTSVIELSYDPLLEPFCVAKALVTTRSVVCAVEMTEVSAAQLSSFVGNIQEAEGFISLKGEVSLSHQGDLLALECVADCKHFKIAVPHILAADDLRVNLSYHPSNRQLPFWEQLTFLADVQEGSYALNEKCLVKGISGKISLIRDTSFFELTGNVRTDQESVPFALQGQGLLNAMQVECALGSDAKISSLSSFSGKNYEIAADFSKVPGRYARIVAPVVLQGVYSGKVILKGEVSHLETVHVDSLSAEDVCFGDLFCCKHLNASGDLSYQHTWKIETAAVSLSEGAFQYGEYFGKEITTSFVLKNQKMESLDFQGEVCGLEGRVTPSTSHEGPGYFDFSFQGKVPHLSSPCKIAGALLQEDLFKSLVVGTVFYEEEPFSFGASLDRFNFLEGWIEKKGVGSSLFSSLIGRSLPGCLLEGSFDLIATFDQAGCQIVLSSDAGMEVSYQGASVLLPSLNLQEKTPGIFSYQWKEKTVQAAVPLRDAKITCHGVQVEHLYGDLKVEKGMIRLDRYEAECLGTPIQGKGVLSVTQGLKGQVTVELPSDLPISKAELVLDMDPRGFQGFTCIAYQNKVPLATLSGHLQSTGALWSWEIDPSSHLFGVPLNVSRLTTDLFSVEELALHPIFSAKLIAYSLEFLEKMHLAVSPSLLEKARGANLDGQIDLHVSYLKNQGVSLRGVGKNTKMHDSLLGDLNFTLKSQGSDWLLEGLEVASLHLAGKIAQKGSEGYSFSEVRGSFKEVEFSGNAFWNAQQASLLGKIDLIYQDLFEMTYKTHQPVSFSYSETQGLAAENIVCDLYDKASQAHLGFIRARKGFIFQETKTGEGIFFSLSPTVLRRLETKLPAWMSAVSLDRYIEGEGDLRVSPEGVAFKGSLQEGNYQWEGRQIPLEKIAVQFEKSIVSVRAKTALQENAPCWLEAHINTGHFPYGMVKITSSLQKPGIKALFKSDETGYFLESIQGELYGMTAALEKSRSSYLPHSHVLSGSLSCDFAQLKFLFPQDVQKKISSLKMGSGYAFYGDLVFPKDKKMTASGKIMGKNTELLGFSFESLSGKMQYSSDKVEISDLQFEDPAGQIQIRKFTCENKGGWYFSLPLFKIKDLKPSLLSTIGQGPSPEKPFKITNLHLEGIRGKFEDAMTWEGQGSLHFTNAVKKESSFWDAPLDLLKKVGLDPSLLTPICGDIDLKLAGDKLYFDHLKNAFSEGERAQFFLSVDQPSYIDLDGNIRIDLRMRQEVFLKFTEKLILTVRGTLEKPKYGLQY